MAQEIARAYIQLIPSAQGIEGSIAGLLGDESDAAGKEAGNRFGESFKNVASIFVDAIKSVASSSLDFLKDSVSVGAEFDSAMSQVAATMGVSVDSISNLREFAKEMGSTTAFSASQAAEALNYMALAGYDSATMTKMLPTVLDLAAAGGMELAEASDMVTDASAALGLDIEQTAAMVDQMAKASSSSNTSVAQLGSALLTVGGTAKDLQGGVLEASTALGILADNGIKGAEGGTALRNIMLSLEAPTDKAAATMETIGLNAFDAAGNLRSLNDIFADLNGAMSSMTSEQRTNVLNNIFNKVDLKSVNALLANTGTNMGVLATNYKSIKTALQDSDVWDATTEKVKGIFGDFNELDVLDAVATELNEIVGGSYGDLTENEQIELLQQHLNVTKKEAKGLIATWTEQTDTMTELGAKIGETGVEWEKYGERYMSSMSDSQTLGILAEDIVEYMNELGKSAEETAAIIAESWEIDPSDAMAAINALLANTGTNMGVLATNYKSLKTALQDSDVWDATTEKVKGIFDGFNELDVLDAVATELNEIVGGSYGDLTENEQIELLQQHLNVTEKEAKGLIATWTEQTNTMTELGAKIGETGVEWEKYGERYMSSMSDSQTLGILAEDIVENMNELGKSAEETAAIIAESWKIDPSDAMTAIEAIMGSVEEEGVRWDELTGKIDDSTGAAHAMAETQLDNLEGDITRFGSALEGAQIAISEGMMPTLREFVQFGAEGISKLTEAFKEGGFAGVMDALGGILADGLAMLMDTLPEVIELGGQLLMSLIDGLVANLPMVAEAAIKCVVTLAEGLASALPQLIPGVVAVVMEIAAVLVENAPLILNAGVALITGLAQGLINAVPDLVQRVPEVIKGLIVGIVANAPMMIEAAVQLILALGSGLIGAIPDLLMAIPEIIGAVVLALREAWPQFIESGKHLIEGIGQGFMDAVTYIVDRIKDIGARIIQGFKEFFGIHSPSTVMAEIGGYLIEGIVQGLADTWHLVIDFFAGVWQGIVDGAQMLVEGISAVFTAARDAAVAVWQSAQEAFAAVWQAIQGAFQGAAEWFGTTFTAAKEAAVNAWQNVREAFGAVIEGIKGAFEGIGEWMSQTFSAAKEAAVKAWDGIKDAFSAIWQGIQSVFEGVGEWFNTIFTEAKEVIAGVWEDVGEIFASVWETIQSVFDGIADWFGDTFSAAKDAAVSAWEAITEAFSAIWQNIQGVFADVGAWFSETFSAARDMAAAAWETIVEAFTTVKENIVNVYQDLSERLGAFFDAAKERAVAAWENVHEAFVAIKEKIQDAFSGLVEWAGDHFAKAKDKAVGAWNDIKSKFTEVWKKIKEAFSLKDATQWGKDMISNFVNGIKSAAANVTAAVSDVAGKVKSRLGFSEPEEGPLSNFHTYAPDMMDLFASGILDSVGVIQEALDEALTMTTPTIDVSKVDTITASDSAITAGSLEAGTTTTAASEVSYNFYSPKALDPVSAMREARKASQRMAMSFV